MINNILPTVLSIPQPVWIDAMGNSRGLRGHGLLVIFSSLCSMATPINGPKCGLQFSMGHACTHATFRKPMPKEEGFGGTIWATLFLCEFGARRVSSAFCAHVLTKGMLQCHSPSMQPPRVCSPKGCYGVHNLLGWQWWSWTGACVNSLETPKQLVWARKKRENFYWPMWWVRILYPGPYQVTKVSFLSALSTGRVTVSFFNRFELSTAAKQSGILDLYFSLGPLAKDEEGNKKAFCEC